MLCEGFLTDGESVVKLILPVYCDVAIDHLNSGSISKRYESMTML